jgi:hypothetical protein
MSRLHRSPSRIFWPFLAAFLFVLFLCASPYALAHSRCETRAARAHLSLRVRELESWEPVDGRTLLVWAPDATRAHLLHLDRWVEELAGSPILTLVDGDHDGAITACGHDGILVTGSKAMIRSIEYLSAKRTAELDRGRWDVPPIEARAPVSTRRRLNLARVTPG